MRLSPPGDENLSSLRRKFRFRGLRHEISHRSIDLERQILATRGQINSSTRVLNFIVRLDERFSFLVLELWFFFTKNSEKNIQFLFVALHCILGLEMGLLKECEKIVIYEQKGSCLFYEERDDNFVNL